MPKQWQEALKHWDEWNNSVDEMRRFIQSEYGDVARLSAEAKFKIEVEGTSDDFVINAGSNEAEGKLREIVGRLRCASDDFVLNRIGICPNIFQRHVFQTLWLKSVFPALEKWFELEYTVDEEMSTPWYSPYMKKVDDKEFIIDRVCWYRKIAEPGDIIRLLAQIWRKDDDEIRKRLKGGPRPKLKDHKEYPEAIVCYVLMYKQGEKGMTEEEIADVFNWGSYPDQDSYNQVRSSTVRKRLRLIKRLICTDVARGE